MCPSTEIPSTGAGESKLNIKDNTSLSWDTIRLQSLQRLDFSSPVCEVEPSSRYKELFVRRREGIGKGCVCGVEMQKAGTGLVCSL